MAERSLVWFRNDLRIADNPALSAAMSRGGPVDALYVEETDDRLRPMGAAARWWLHHSLQRLAEDLANLGIQLRSAHGEAATSVFAVATEAGSTAIFWNRRYAPVARELDAAIKKRAESEGMAARGFPANVLVEPFDIATGEGRPYSVFTPFWRALRQKDIPSPVASPRKSVSIAKPRDVDAGYRTPRWAQKFEMHCDIGEAAAHRKLERFLDSHLDGYAAGRDLPAKPATSRLSPHLRFGEISPRQIWQAATFLAHRHPGKAAAVDRFLSELAWRDFNYHQLYHRKDIARMPMQEKFEGFEWRHAPEALEAWQQGRTGVPIVDAGMREMWETGIMHNRVRMLTASFLAKNLLIDWRLGEQWFWDCLIDADEANNPGNWQWVAGCGLDASPYFRIFNPVTQGERFDPEGHYVRQWVPEVAELPDGYVHRPWEATPKVLTEAGTDQAGNYPRPIVDLGQSRQRALDAFAML